MSTSCTREAHFHKIAFSDSDIFLEAKVMKKAPTGRILAACPPFHLGETGHSGWIIYSDDNGKSWNKLSDFFNSPNGEIAAWECRLCEIDNNGVAVIFWTYDNIKKPRIRQKPKLTIICDISGSMALNSLFA